MKVNKKELAEIFDISERTFTDYQKDKSFPIEVDAGRGKSNVYDTGEVFRWLVARAEGQKAESTKERLDRLRGDREELNLAKDAGELVPVDELERVLTDVIIAIRNTQLHGNAKLKQGIDQQYKIDLDIELLNDHSREVLSHLSGLSENFAVDSGEEPEEIHTA